MTRKNSRRDAFAGIFALTTAFASAGCGNGAPPVDTSMAEATVTGNVTYKGTPVNEGEVMFNPANVKRRDAPINTAPIKDGKYSVTTLVGENTITFVLPTIGKKDASIAFAKFIYEVPSSGGSIDLPLPKE